MKIKLLREEGAVEIARFVSSAEGRGTGEWITKFLNMDEEQLKRGGDIGLELTEEEREGMNCVIGGSKVWETAEEQCMKAIPNGGEDYASEDRAHLGEKPGVTEDLVSELARGSQEKEAWTLPSPRTEDSTPMPRAISVLPLSVTPRPTRISSAVHGTLNRRNNIKKPRVLVVGHSL